MIPNSNLSILPFYESINEQNHRKDYAFGEEYHLLAQQGTLPPFQILTKNLDPPGIDSCYVYYKNGNLYQDISTEMQNAQITSVYENSHYVIGYAGGPIGVDLPEGQYYLRVSDSVNVWYSDIFTIVNSTSDLLKITYWDDENLWFDEGVISYAEYFKWFVYLPTQLGKPEYPIDEEVDVRDGKEYTTKQISRKVFKFTFLAPEYLLDAMRIIRLSDHIQVYNKGKTYKVNKFLITPTWEAGGILASVEAEFECNTIVKKTGRLGTGLSGVEILGEDGVSVIENEAQDGYIESE